LIPATSGRGEAAGVDSCGSVEGTTVSFGPLYSPHKRSLSSVSASGN
jgi:hypothetical protein